MRVPYLVREFPPLHCISVVLLCRFASLCLPSPGKCHSNILLFIVFLFLILLMLLPVLYHMSFPANKTHFDFDFLA